EDRHGRQNVLAPTAEEVVTSVAAGEIKSYKQLPVNLYQISFKFRDEFRPRFGVLRSREFIMKDAYSFNADAESLDKEYWNMYETYKRIFKRCGLDYVIVEAETGEMGGSGSHQFTIPCESGEDVIVYTQDGSYAANIEKAGVDALPGHKTQDPRPKTEEVYTPNVGSIESVCAFLKTKPQNMIKTLIYWKKNEVILDEYQSAKRRVLQHGKTFLNWINQRFGENAQWSDDKKFNEELQNVALEGEKPDAEKVIAMCRSAVEFKDALSKIRGLFTAVLVRGDHEVNPEKLAQFMGSEHLELASETAVETVTNAKVGFAGPLNWGIPPGTILVDYAVAAMAIGVTGANKTDYHVKNVVPGRDFPLQGDNIIVADIRNAVKGDTHNGKKLQFKHGIEVGQVFKLGTKYSAKLGCNFLDETGKEKPCLMGCYGIGINRIVASAIEVGNDENGIIFPVSIAPFEVIIVSVNQDDAEVVKAADDIYKQLLDKGIEVLLDDRDERAGVKFKDADLIGIPVRITVGKKALATSNVEIKLRSEPKPTLIPVTSAVEKAIELVNSLKQKLNAS
ncbi:MAG: aminoacyl--tRNA ligase-related protein, partial [Sedimentisphaerales bacterium]